MSSIDQLKSSVTTGFARSNRYRVLFHTDSETLDVLCDSVGWPGRQIFTQDRTTNMKVHKVAYAFGHEDVPISFILTNDFRVWDFINEWHKTIIGNVDRLNSYRVNFKSEYARDIEIHHLNSLGYINKRIKLMNAFPTTLSSVELGNGNENEIIRVSTEFSYDNWKSLDY